MTIRQKMMTLLYPLVKKLAPTKHGPAGRVKNEGNIRPSKSFYELGATRPDGSRFEFSGLKGKKVVIVNTASDCGFTPQYKELEALYKSGDQDLTILAFPSNDFKGQEPGSDENIARFCEINYGVTFPLFQKDSVLAPENQEVYNWLTDKKMNGWNEMKPTWNFCKYLVDEAGVLQAIYGPEVSPLSII